MEWGSGGIYCVGIVNKNSILPRSPLLNEVFKILRDLTMINRTFASGIQFTKQMCANDIYPFSTLNRYVGYSPHTFPTLKLTYRNETHRTQHAKDEHPNKFKSVELCDLQCAIRDIFLEEKKTSRTMKILSLKQCRECHLLRMQRRISRKFNSYNARGAFFWNPVSIAMQVASVQLSHITFLTKATLSKTRL